MNPTEGRSFCWPLVTKQANKKNVPLLGLLGSDPILRAHSYA